jgi:hypothetical protein
MTRPRAVWVMVPAGAVDKILDELAAHLQPGDIVIDGGNSNYRDDIRRATARRNSSMAASCFCTRPAQRLSSSELIAVAPRIVRSSRS